MAEDFIGKGWGFPPHFNKYEGVEMVSGREEIEQSLKILFSTSVRERLFHPDFGCDLRRFQYASNNRMTLLHIQKMVETTVRQYEPRIILNSVDVNIEEIMDGKFVLILNYTIRTTNTRYNMVYPYYF
ncbi:MAG: GPW/gp25 family protein [Paludibacteraceae bacterium]|nr:GPW/gp25 family protein [Paludibacteraceae bacterium]MBR5373634.1 GPW/gp25 family protein [Paludibacteraceae bacterium]